METVGSIFDLPAIKPMKATLVFTGSGWVITGWGVEQISQSEILLILIAHRKDIYKRFP
jgi:hypothetical protein